MKILEAAGRLFYDQGVLSVGVDTVAQEAGVTKRTLYYHFTSKDDMIRAYLEHWDEPTFHRYKNWAKLENLGATIGERMEAIFMNLARRSQNPEWRGCGFSRSISELAHIPTHPAFRMAVAHKSRVESWFREELQAEGYDDPDSLARTLILILDGTTQQLLLHRDKDYALAAGKAVRTLLETANRKGPEPSAKLH